MKTQKFKTEVQDLTQRVEALEAKLQADAIIDKEQVAYLSKLPVNVIIDSVVKNKIPYFKIGRKIYFYRHEVLNWLKMEGQNNE